ncbi:MAG: hypothetical protein JRI36_09290 [Deltaproteobacteria bacterium]|nr:hypothetical protein [Deltaproteobacteria bacterium]
MDSVNINITVGRSTSVGGNASDKRKPYTGPKQGARKDRRRNKQDRRKSVRDGIIVSLSVENDRRVMRDRRRAGS